MDGPSRLVAAGPLRRARCGYEADAGAAAAGFADDEPEDPLVPESDDPDEAAEPAVSFEVEEEDEESALLDPDESFEVEVDDELFFVALLSVR